MGCGLKKRDMGIFDAHTHTHACTRQASFPGTRSNVLARKLAMLEGLLAEVPRHEGQEKEVLAATVKKLAPVLIAELGLDQGERVYGLLCDGLL